MSLSTTPTSRIAPPTPRFSRIVAARWAEWEAATMIWLQSHWNGIGGSTSVYASMVKHRDWVTLLLLRGIPLRSIRRHAMDDPREPDAVLEQRVEAYLNRRARRKHACS